ncbi:Rab1a [Hexamita inflata]|uniref:Rab1a n=1 Tax=Hexamita inflata TaxID=28002 RepID=A0AA86RE54_9EUKA|nr:Rab1a [Hexamita inflata]
MPLDDQTHISKVILIGSQGCGKSNIISRYCINQFSEERICLKSHIEIFANREYIQADNKEQRVPLVIFDTSGGDEPYTKLYYQSAGACMVVYDVTDIESYKSVARLVGHFNHPADIPFILVGNKIDAPNRVISQEQADELAKSLGENVLHYFVSAKTGENIDIAFHELAQAIYDCYSKKFPDHVWANDVPKQKKGCCGK